MLGFGVLLTALLLGVRHAFDADHIAAIDNVTRQLMGRDGTRTRGRAAGAVGFFFAAGHSTVVLAMSVLTIAGAAFARPLLADDSPGRQALGLFGSCVSIGFLLIVGLMNLKMLIGLIRGAQKTAPGWLLRKTELVTRPWQMFFVGFLFGLGFDTATEIALLVLAATTAASGASLWLALAVPLSFAVGMSFFDTLDGWLMGLVYRSTLVGQDRERWYNLAFTGLSVVVALGVGLVELAGLILGEDLVDSERVGYAVVALFVALWAARLASAARSRAAARS
ncbi:high frequency lysogenization protein HflD [Segniliparus rugosus]|uniref:Nickel/cobalt efflux system n=1 Tax=Segniliparus rugosus (strain ATCC BAA-974 / DSM 45345 / CCUG 50838 / CIP 108380 / JCM 13579 / CDC 945) TaxID=679197 RepID=E5XQZ0_SEGRC|nr:high frequency lysogenization protein HflD [Segniliparus rugosus]EFV13230.1 Ni2+-Co2+ transporter (NiCoT) family transition metal uptake transporter [Segniliparus rugosus ATCC BAA-974]